MKFLLIFASIVTIAKAGVTPWSREAEAEALKLFRQYCGSGSDNGVDGSLFWYCKSTRETNEESYQHNIELNDATKDSKQVVFVQPPPVKYNHNVVISGAAGGGQKTSIYVLPQKAEHALEYQDERQQSGTPDKPSLFFLKSNPNESSSGSSPESQPSSPPNDPYLPPRRS